MSWFKSAVSKAVEVGNKNNLTGTVKNYADSVVQQAGHAVAEGPKILHDRIEIEAEVSGLVRLRDELEAELKKVNISLAAAQARLHNVREEKDQFYEANDQIVAHLKSKEDEPSKSVGSCRVKADVLGTWINFLEDTWVLQCSYAETKEKEINDELQRHEGYFVNLVIQLLSTYEKELKPSIDRIGKYVENLKSLSGRSLVASTDKDASGALNPRKNLEEEYLGYEAKTKFRMENPTREAESSSGEKHQETVSNPAGQTVEITEAENSGASAKPVVKSEQLFDSEAELAKLESEFGKVNQVYSAEEIGDWEFDELEREFTSGDTATKK